MINFPIKTATFYKNTLTILIGIFLGLFLIIMLYESLSIDDTKNNNANELALGKSTTSKYASINDFKIHCSGPLDDKECINGSIESKIKSNIVYLGNSQVHSINQIKSLDKTVIEIMHNYFIKLNLYLTAYTQANASLEEHYLLFENLRNKFPVKYLILPLVMDDMREYGARDSIKNLMKLDEVSLNLSQNTFGRELIKEFRINRDNKSKKDNNGLHLQIIIEDYLNKKLSKICSAWSDRALLRSEIFGFLYNLRNFVFQIDSTSIRKMLPATYKRNTKALISIFKVAKENDIVVIPYIVPIRNDHPIPYNKEAYIIFKKEIKKISLLYGFPLLNLENKVHNHLWGFNESISLGSEVKGIDFMHFQGEGHQILASHLIDYFKTNILFKERKLN